MGSQARREFADLVTYVDQLITIHGKLQKGKGRRHKQDAIHRAGVVMMVAAWESYIEKIVMEAVCALEASAAAASGGSPSTVPAWARHAFALRKAEIAKTIKRFNTPDATKVRDLLSESLEFSPWGHWSWQVKRRQWDAKAMRNRLDAWILIRHSVAHGFPLPADVEWLQDGQGRPRLTLRLLQECKGLIERLVSQTDAALASHLHLHHGIRKPW